jgi:hypothetical protein
MALAGKQAVSISISMNLSESDTTKISGLIEKAILCVLSASLFYLS